MNYTTVSNIFDSQTNPSISKAYNLVDHFKMPFSRRYETTTVFEGVTYVLSPVTKNPLTGLLTFDITWFSDFVTGSAQGLHCLLGVDLLQQTVAPLPSLVAVNLSQGKQDPTEIEDLELLIITDYDKYFVGVR